MGKETQGLDTLERLQAYKRGDTKHVKNGTWLQKRGGHVCGIRNVHKWRGNMKEKFQRVRKYKYLC